MTLQQQFEAFIGVHPEAYTEFKRMALSLRQRGWRHYSARTIVSVMRFHSDVDGRDVERYRINNNHSPYLARRLEAEDSRFRGFFEKRSLAVDGASSV